MLPFIFLYALSSVLWLTFFARRRLHLSASAPWIVFGMGLLSGPIAGILNHNLEALLVQPGDSAHTSAAILYFGVVGPVEEIVKFLAVLLIALRRQDFGHAADGMLLACAAALGFACGENVLYLLSYGVHATLPRLVLTNLGHPAFSIIWGYALGVVLFEKASFALLPGSLFLSAFLHGFYDFLLEFGLPGLLLAMLVLACLIFFMFWFLRSERKRQAGRIRSFKKPENS